MVKIGVLDDEVVICETIVKYLLDLGYSAPEYALNYDEAIELLRTYLPDVMLLDINIGGQKSGIDLARHIRSTYSVPLIFISSYSDSKTVQEATHVKPNGYLVKPFTKNDLFVAIETALSNYSKEISTQAESTSQVKLLPDSIFVKQDSLFVKLPFSEILYFKSDGVYIEIFTLHKKYLIRETMKSLLSLLPENQFFQTHRSYIVHLKHIDAVNTEYIVVNNENLPLSRTQREEFLMRMNII